MDIDIEDFRHHFELLSDESLLATNRDELVEAAKAVYDQEVEHRGLNHPPADVERAPDGAHTDTAETQAEDLVSIGSFTIVDEARMAQGLLRGAGIPCGLASEKSALGALHLMVPESHLEAAMEILGGEISEEELAAQAEAAGYQEEPEAEPET